METLKINENIIKKEQLPEVLEPKHIQQILNIGRRQTYELLENPPFHVVRVGRLYKISKRAFFNWLDGLDGEQQEV